MTSRWEYTFEETQALSDQEKKSLLNFVKLKCKYQDNVELMGKFAGYEACVHDDDWSWLSVNNAARFAVINFYDSRAREQVDHFAQRFFR